MNQVALHRLQRLSVNLFIGTSCILGLFAPIELQAQAPGENTPPVEFIVPPPPPPPPHPMAQMNEGPVVQEDLRSPRQILYEQCLDRMADLPDAPEDYVARCMGEAPTTGAGSHSTATPATPPSTRQPVKQHMVPGFSAKNLSKQAEPIASIVAPCYDGLLKSLRKRGLSGQGDTSITVFLRDTGRIEFVNVDESEIVDEKFLSCIESAIKKSWKVTKSTSASGKRNALNSASMVLTFDSVGATQPKHKITVSGIKRVQLGGLSTAEISKSLSKQAGQLKSCKASVLPPEVIAARKAGSKPVIVINMDVDFVIDEGGKVSELTVTELSTPDSAFKKCIADRISNWAFQKPKGRQKTPVNQSLKLTPIANAN